MRHPDIFSVLYSCFSKGFAWPSCPYCENRAFKRPHELVNHMLYHVGDGSLFPYKCPFGNCSYGSPRKLDVVRHAKSKSHRDEWASAGMRWVSVSESS